ncbi:OsmC family protein [Halovivax cerinus]|uniref:OsmC family protein n=1 Tax=Halovivax cerinus TaxID=1487865 RepID=A0ABD5NP71_9EURY|nr:OsmC family protein [Halovivax cerinus]
MSKNVTTVSDEGYASTNDTGDFEWTVDATAEEAPDTLEALLGAYASCYVPALRVAGEQRDAGDLGRIRIDATGDLNDDDKLASISFDIDVEPDLDEETAAAVIERANELCKVHDALKPQLHAEMNL